MPDEQRLVELARELDGCLLEDRRITAAGVNLRSSRIRVEVLNSRGLRSLAHNNVASLDAWCVAESAGARFEVRESRLVSGLDQTSVQSLGRDLAQRAILSLIHI